jgi:hypothetical protein
MVAGAAVLVACSAPSHADDRDLWWLVDAAESQVPLTVEKVERLLGTSLHAATPYRWEGDAATMGPSLTVTDAATTANGDRQEFTYFGVDLGDCVPLDDALARYPGLSPKFMPTGHSEAEDEVWAVPREWGGELMFGIDPRTRSIHSVSLHGP